MVFYSYYSSILVFKVSIFKGPKHLCFDEEVKELESKD